ncbi:MAG: MCP four helix bundle domain-containing protein [Cyclobacteriaceae bacterium]
MRWTYSVKNKLTASLLLCGVIVVVLLNNINERYNNAELKTAFDAIYQDRLLAESYILDFSENLHDIQDALNNDQLSDSVKLSTAIQQLSELDRINQLYEATKLTDQERQYYAHFSSLTEQISHDLYEGDFKNEGEIIHAALMDLHSLSELQLSEAQKLKERTNKLFNMGNIASQFEIVLLIIIGLVIQTLLFSSRILNLNKISQDPRLN